MGILRNLNFSYPAAETSDQPLTLNPKSVLKTAHSRSISAQFHRVFQENVEKILIFLQNLTAISIPRAFNSNTRRDHQTAIAEFTKPLFAGLEFPPHPTPPTLSLPPSPSFTPPPSPGRKSVALCAGTPLCLYCVLCWGLWTSDLCVPHEIPLKPTVLLGLSCRGAGEAPGFQIPRPLTTGIALPLSSDRSLGKIIHVNYSGTNFIHCLGFHPEFLPEIRAKKAPGLQSGPYTQAPNPHGELRPFYQKSTCLTQ